MLKGEEAAAGGGAPGDMVSSALDPSWGEKRNPLASSHTRPCSPFPTLVTFNDAGA